MSDSLRDQVYNELKLRQTDELLQIWYTHDEEEWSDVAFEVVRDLLIERLGAIPPQPERQETVDQAEPDDGLEEWEAKALDDENQPEFYDTLEVITLKENINKALKAIIVIYIGMNIVNFAWYRSVVAMYFQNSYDFALAINGIAVLVAALGTLVQIAITYYPLKALMEILKILMEMEFRSRKVG